MQQVLEYSLNDHKRMGKTKTIQTGISMDGNYSIPGFNNNSLYPKLGQKALVAVLS